MGKLFYKPKVFSDNVLSLGWWKWEPCYINRVRVFTSYSRETPSDMEVVKEWLLQKGRTSPREGSETLDLQSCICPQHCSSHPSFSPCRQILFRSSPSHYPSVQKMSLRQVLRQILQKCFVSKLLMSQMLILHLSHFSLTWCLGEGEMGGWEALCLCRCTSHLWILLWSAVVWAEEWLGRFPSKCPLLETQAVLVRLGQVILVS